MSTLAFYGRLYGRGPTKVQSTISTALLTKAFELAMGDDEDAKEDFMDKIADTRLSIVKWALLSAIIFKENPKLFAKAHESWKSTGKFALVGEEFTAAVGATIDEAKMLFVDAEDALTF